MTDIFEFWAQMKRGQLIHPADAPVFARMDAAKHGFQLHCLPTCFNGRLKTAPVVLLFLSPGYDEDFDPKDARSEEGIDYCFRKWSGNEPFRDNVPSKKWIESRTKQFADYEIMRHHIATLNIGAYKSKNVKSYSSLLALPSSRVALSWAQDVLFPQAEAGNRIVVCMRSAAWWGLETGRRYGEGLFAPDVNRSGYLLKDEMNQSLTALIQKRLNEAAVLATPA